MIVVILERDGKNLAKTTLPAIAAAIEMKALSAGDARLIGLVFGGSEAAQAAKEASEYPFDEVCHLRSDILDTYLALNYEAACKEFFAAMKPEAVISASTAVGKDLLPRLAVLLEGGQASDVVAILQGGKFRRQMFAGNVIAEVELLSTTKLVTVRPSAFPPAAKAGAGASVRDVPLNIAPDVRQRFVSFESVKSERPDLATARIVVSGGRAMQSAENFEKYIAPLADVLGAAIGASRAAVDSGYAPNDWQVGQTGKVVAPDLYIAVGISGAIQHLAGMKDSKVIVAINKDGEAPIFEVADYGLVADLYQAVPELTNELAKRRA